MMFPFIAITNLLSFSNKLFDPNNYAQKRKAGGHEDPKQRTKEKKEPLFICGDRPRDVKNGNATILHCCDYNPVSGY